MWLHSPHFIRDWLSWESTWSASFGLTISTSSTRLVYCFFFEVGNVSPSRSRSWPQTPGLCGPRHSNQAQEISYRNCFFSFFIRGRCFISFERHLFRLGPLDHHLIVSKPPRCAMTWLRLFLRCVFVNDAVMSVCVCECVVCGCWLCLCSSSISVSLGPAY